MLRMNFRPKDVGNMKLQLATFSYAGIWAEDGERIQQVFKELTGLNFKRRHITAIVAPGKGSKSGGLREHMKLSAEQYMTDLKRSHLTHELAHRLLSTNGIWIDDDANRAWHYYEHTRIYLFLYDAWEKLYGKKYADTESQREIRLNGRFYAKAWRWALAKTFAERQKSLASLTSDAKVAHDRERFG